MADLDVIIALFQRMDMQAQRDLRLAAEQYASRFPRQAPSPAPLLKLVARKFSH